MKCTHCSCEVGFIKYMFLNGFCSEECKIAYEDIEINKTCEKVDFGNYEFPEVNMGDLKKSEENLEEGNEEFDEDVVISSNSYYEPRSIYSINSISECRDDYEYYEYCRLHDIDTDEDF